MKQTGLGYRPFRGTGSTLRVMRRKPSVTPSGLVGALDVRATIRNSKSLDLNGSSQYFAVPPAPAISFGGEDFTIEGYVKLDAKSSPYPAQFLAFKKALNQPDSRTDYGFMVQAGSYGRTGRELALMLGDGLNNTQIVLSSLEITDTSWHYVSVSYNATTRAVRFILDASTDPKMATQQTYSPNSGDLVIGAYHDQFGRYQYYLSGLVDEVRISRGVVALDQLLKADPPQWPTVPVEGYWPCQGASGYFQTMTIADLSGNGLDGTAVGGPAYTTDIVVDEFALPRRYVPQYDGGGNVVQMMNATPGTDFGTIAARYEYDPYGNIIAMSGTYAADNPFRFSTKHYDEVDYPNTNSDGLYYYGYRYYSPRMGRWLNRDPMGEHGGINRYSFVWNEPTNLTDSLGLWSMSWVLGGRWHEDMVEKAFRKISCYDRWTSRCGAKYLEDALEVASCYPDAPEGETEVALQIGIGWPFRDETSLTYRSHEGDLQWWHGMAYPGATAQEVIDKIVDLAKSQASDVRNEDEDVVGYGPWCKDCYYVKKAFESWTAVHVLADTYCRSHVARDASGAIKHIQSYKDQDRDLHKGADNEVGSKEYQAAIDTLTRYMEMVLCKHSSKADIEDWLRNEALRLADGAWAGGTEDEFSPARARARKEQETDRQLQELQLRGTWPQL